MSFWRAAAVTLTLGSIAVCACATAAVPLDTQLGADASVLPPGCAACAGATPKCDTVKNVCVECAADGDCASGKKCDPATHACRFACTTDSDCKDPAAKRCDVSAHACVACLTTSDTCPGATYCAKGKDGVAACQPGCKTVADCNNLDAGAPGDSGGGSGPPSFSCCNHQCADTSADGKNCGACGAVCGATQGCCSSACLEEQSSVSDCGGCGKVCAPANVTTAQCASGACGYDTCAAGFGDCDKDKSNGCELDVTTDKQNCGQCGKACNVSEQCVAGVCVTCSGNEVAYNGHCYYLDGSGGACDPNYSRAPESVMAVIVTQFIGKNYMHKVSSNCCIWTSDVYENYGMTSQCNSNGPFTSGNPQAGGAGCTQQQNHGAGQLTFCGSN